MKHCRHLMHLLGLSLLITWSGAIAQTQFNAKVIRVADGDSITVQVSARERYEIRLGAIDAPEKGQPYGKASRKNLASLLAGETVLVNFYKIDRFGRMVAKVLIDGRDAGLAQIRAGMAWHFKRYAKEQSRKDKDLYSASENKARKAQVGLWREPDAQPPWAYRRKSRND